MKKRIHLVAGARPNFMKIAPVYHELVKSDWAKPIIVHTGQHYSSEMSDVFFHDLRLPRPDYHLNAVGTTHGEQTASVLSSYEELCFDDKPDWTVVVGDVNSTLAACLAAKKLHIPVAHLEAGLRSGDRTMPEEINRLAVDAISDLLWTPSDDANINLKHEGIPDSRISKVGNIMIDAYCTLIDSIDKKNLPEKLGLNSEDYAVVTLHRPSNVDRKESLTIAVNQLIKLSKKIKIAFPVHPRTKKKLLEYDLLDALENNNVKLIEPLSYIEFMSLVKNCSIVITDSGGVQEETTYLGIPCLTARDSTERPITITMGTNKLISLPDICTEVDIALNAEIKKVTIPLWDGKSASRIANSLQMSIENKII